VIAFAKTTAHKIDGRFARSSVDKDQLDQLGIAVKEIVRAK